MKRAQCRICGQIFPYLVMNLTTPRCHLHVKRDARGRFTK